MRINFDDITFSFGAKRIFSSFSFTIDGRSPLVILGPSGCGKTTLLRLCAGLLKPDDGTINRNEYFDISFVFQEDRLFPQLTVLENVMLPVRRALGEEAARQRALEVLALTGLAERADALPRELSGGQKQRASLARAWAYGAPLILMDEPFQSLDIPLRVAMMDAVRTLLEKDRGRTFVIVTHDPRDALYLGRRIVVLGDAGTVILNENDDTPLAAREYAAPNPLEKRILDALGRR